MKTVRFKFCGGCNPGYDRVAAAGKIREQLEKAGCRAAAEGEEAEAAVVICGCACACADVSGLKAGQTIVVTRPEDAALFFGLTGESE